MPRRRMRALLLATLLAAACPLAAQPGSPAPGAPGAADDPQAWLDRMQAALVLRAFSGTFVYLRDGQLDALRIEHVPDAAGGSRERLWSLSGDSQEVLREPGGVALSAARGRSVWPLRQSWPGVPASRRAAPALYDLRFAGEDRIADRPALVVDIRPRDSARYGYRLWLDRASALLLKSLTMGPDGRPVEQIMFTEFSVGELEDAVPAPPVPTPPPAPSQSWSVLGLPDGFSLAGSEEGASTHLLFSDGIAHVSVYVEPLAADRPTLSGLLSRGALQVFGRVAHGRQIVAVGDAPATTIERFAQGVVPLGSAASPP